MTCIIGYIDKKNDCVWIGGDSLGSNGRTKTVYSQPKVFRNEIVSQVIMGSTCTFRHIDLLKYSKDLFNKIDKYEIPEIDHKYMVTKFVPKIITLFQDGIIDEDEKNRGANFIIGANNKLYEIQCDYSVMEPQSGYCAVGCGADVAMGSLITTENIDMEVSEKIYKALEASEKYSCGVERPFLIINTKDGKEVWIK